MIQRLGLANRDNLLVAAISTVDGMRGAGAGATPLPLAQLPFYRFRRIVEPFRLTQDRYGKGHDRLFGLSGRRRTHRNPGRQADRTQGSDDSTIDRRRPLWSPAAFPSPRRQHSARSGPQPLLVENAVDSSA